MADKDTPGPERSESADSEYRSAVQTLDKEFRVAVQGSPSIRKFLMKAGFDPNPSFVDLRLQGEAVEDAQRLLLAVTGTDGRPPLEAIVEAIAALEDARADHEATIMEQAARARIESPSSSSGLFPLPAANRAMSTVSPGTLPTFSSAVTDHSGHVERGALAQTQVAKPSRSGFSMADADRFFSLDGRVNSTDIKIDQIIELLVQVLGSKAHSAAAPTVTIGARSPFFSASTAVHEGILA